MTLARLTIGAAVVLIGLMLTATGLALLAQDVADLVRYPDPEAPDLVVSGFVASLGFLVIIAGTCTLRCPGFSGGR